MTEPGHQDRNDQFTQHLVAKTGNCGIDVAHLRLAGIEPKVPESNLFSTFHLQKNNLTPVPFGYEWKRMVAMYFQKLSLQ
jgi:hypothetical protein